MKKIILFITVAFLFDSASAQRISYFVSFPNLTHHEAEVSLVINDNQSHNAVFRMSRSSPGRYATHEFGKNIYDVRAFDQKGSPIAINRTDGDVYEVLNHPGYIRVEYTIYGNYADGTYLGIDPSGVHINMPAMFMWIKGQDKTPITIHFDIPQQLRWTIATQLKATADSLTFTAPGLQYFMDCPTKIGNLKYKNWEVKNPDDKTYNFRIAFDAKGDDSTFSAFSAKVARIVKEEQAVYGEVPTYDYGSYTFLASINPYVHGDGMEHRNSTMISLPTEFHGDDFLLEVFAHEFFHCWNVKRIRPRSLEPFNFEKSDMSDELWFAEGFTQYYGELTVVRAGFDKDTSFSSTLTGLVNTKLNTAGAKYFSPIDASRHAVYVDAGVAVDKTNYPNMFTSYYPYGASIALALDLELREQFNKTLDDYMQAAWKRFGKPEIPYTVDGLRETLASVTNNTFASDFFNKYIYGHEAPDYNALFAKAGFIMKKANEGKAWIGNTRFSEKEGLTIASNTIRNSPLYESGLDVDDKIIKLGDTQIKTQIDLNLAIAAHKPGDKLSIIFIHHGEEKTATINLQENPSLIVTTFESAGLPVSPQALSFRKSWLEGQLRIKN
jgi:predicted metalloprotease with PDZ domain